MIPTTQPAHKIAALFKRLPTTHWSDREVRQYKKLVKDGYFKDWKDLELIERYYAFERRKEDKGIHRRDLYTFLNNYAGELDRARAWDERFKPRPYYGQGPHSWRVRAMQEIKQKPTSDEDFKRIADEARSAIEELRRKFNHA